MESVRVGSVFGRLTVQSRTSEGSKAWNCLCTCGGIIQVYESHLLARKKSSCCAKSAENRVDYSGKRYGMLTAIEYAGKEINGNTRWLFRCSCGNEVVKLIRQVRQGMIKSCGCKTNEMISHSLTLPDNQATRNSAYKTHLKVAEKQEHPSLLSLEDYEKIVKNPCRYCGGFFMRRKSGGGGLVPMNSVDRLNNEPYYRLENSVSACMNCQHAKSDMTEVEFKAYIERCYNHMRNGIR